MADLLHTTPIPELTSPATNLFLNDPQNLTGFSQILEELPAVDALPTVTYTLGSRVLSQEKGGTVSHLMTDGHGSTRLVTGPGGVITDRYSYDAYGLGVDFTAGILNPPTTKILYTGEQYDVGLRQIYLRARYYNPAVGRFGVRDTVEGISSDPLTLHKYAYTHNNPVNLRDPSGNFGLMELSTSMTIGVGLELWKSREVLWKGGKLITEGVRAGNTLGQIGEKDASPDVDTATIIVHGVNGPYNGQPTGWSDDFQKDLQAKAGAASAQKGGLGGGAIAGTPINHDFYEFNWGGFSFAGISLYPVECVHQMAFVHLQMAQMLVWMKGYDKINIISHSWGTTLSYDLMNSGGIEMHHWVTMGSPLKSTTDKPVWNTGNWINCYSLNDPVMHYEIYPPFPSFTQMAESVLKDVNGGPGLSVNPNVNINHLPYNMGNRWLFEHIAYWNWAPVVNDLRNDLQ